MFWYLRLQAYLEKIYFLFVFLVHTSCSTHAPSSRNFDLLHPAPNLEPSLISAAQSSYPWSYWKYPKSRHLIAHGLPQVLAVRLCLYLPSSHYSPFHLYLTFWHEIMSLAWPPNLHRVPLILVLTTMELPAASACL